MEVFYSHDQGVGGADNRLSFGAKSNDNKNNFLVCVCSVRRVELENRLKMRRHKISVTGNSSGTLTLNGSTFFYLVPKDLRSRLVSGQTFGNIWQG